MNKNALVRGSVVVALLLTSVVGFTAELTIRLTDPKWDGQQVPKDQVCQKFKGAGATPAMQVTGVPTGTQALVVAFNDESYGPMEIGRASCREPKLWWWPLTTKATDPWIKAGMVCCASTSRQETLALIYRRFPVKPMTYPMG